MESIFFFLIGAIAAAGVLVIGFYAKATLVYKQAIEQREVANRLEELRAMIQQENADLDERTRRERAELDTKMRENSAELDQLRNSYITERESFDSHVVQYDEIATENSELKQDLFNLSIKLKKMDRDHDVTERRQEEISIQSDDIARQYLNDHVEWISSKLNTSNFASSKKRLLTVIEQCREIGFGINQGEEETMTTSLQENFENVVRIDIQRQEQARIKSQIREEQKLEREMQKHIDDAKREQAAIEAALEKALKETHDEHSAEVESLREKLREAEEKAQRALSQAQMTKAGHVYVISNIGSFGEDVFKVGMSRRLSPEDRVKELGDASVPFPFDVHMMISCDDAPTLENALHKELHLHRVNKVNLRKEFFRCDFERIRDLVAENHGEVEYVAAPEALQYRESLEMSDDDYAIIEHAFDASSNDFDKRFED